MQARGLTNGAIAVAGFLATAVLIRSLLPLPQIEPISAKLHYYQAHRATIDTLFLGSSRVYQHVSPALFDEEAGRREVPLHSFNFGVNGMFLAEESYLLDQVLAQRGGKLRFVFLELESLPLGFDPNNMGSQRIGYWHDWARTHALLQKIFRVDENGKSKKARDIILGQKKQERRHQLLILHLSLFARHFVNLGRAQDVFDWVTHRSVLPDAPSLGPGGDGYRPGTAVLPADKVAEYKNALSAALAASGPEALDRYTEEICRHCADTIRRHGAVPIFVVTPVLDQTQLVFPATAPPPGAILSFNNARRYPEFYRPAVRLDGSHMNRIGAAEFSRQLGRSFAASLQAGEIR